MSGLPRVRLPDGWAPPAGTLAGRVVFVTGACGGLGGAVVRAALRGGATVIISGSRKRPLEKLYDALLAEQPHARLVIHPLDLATATPRDYAALADGLTRDFGRLDGLVHAAARFHGLTPLGMLAPDEWLRTLHINVSAAFALTQACLPLLLAAPDSAAVFVLDDPDRLARAHWGAYGVSKAALERLIAILHEENDEGPLRVHAVLPGPMATGLRQRAYAGEDTAQWPTPEHAADAVAWLLGARDTTARGAVLDLRPA